MELDELSQSGIRRIADYSPYLDQFAGLVQQMGLRQRSNLTHLETALRSHWSLGQNSILSWAPLDQSILILVVPHYAIAEYTSANGELPPRVSPRFVTELISGDRQLSIAQMQKVARLLEIEPMQLLQPGRVFGVVRDGQGRPAAGIRLALEPLHPMLAGDRTVLTTLAEAAERYVVEQQRVAIAAHLG